VALLKSLGNMLLKNVQPSSDILAFLECIELANPNSPDYSKDDINGNWGHYQFTAGNMRITSVLTSWDQVSVKIACKLLTIKTCCIAWHVCFECRVTVGSYLSDAYL
jgi:hypothetical protein